MFLKTVALATLLVSLSFGFDRIDKVSIAEKNDGSKYVTVNGAMSSSDLNLESKLDLEMDRIKSGFYGNDFWQENSFHTEMKMIGSVNYKIESSYSKVTLYHTIDGVRTPKTEIEKSSSKAFSGGDVVLKTRDYTVKK